MGNSVIDKYIIKKMGLRLQAHSSFHKMVYALRHLIIKIS